MFLHSHFEFIFCLSDINECLAGTRVCGEDEVCRNKKNGYKCRCRKGYAREKSVCVRKYFSLLHKILRAL